MKSDSDDDAHFEGDPKKKKKTRNARACLACRKVKTKCVNEGSPPCRRCADNRLECIFEKSNRGGRQPGAKNLATLKAQGLLPSNRDKNVPANKIAQAYARSKSQQSGSAHQQHDPSYDLPILSPELTLSLPLPPDMDSNLDSNLVDHSSLSSSWLSPHMMPSAGNDMVLDSLFHADSPRIDPLLAAVNDASALASPQTELLVQPPQPDQSLHDNDALFKLLQPTSMSFPSPSHALKPNTLRSISEQTIGKSLSRSSRDAQPTTARPVSSTRSPFSSKQLDPSTVVHQAALASTSRDNLGEYVADSPGSSSHHSNSAQPAGVADAAYWQPGPFSDLQRRRQFILDRQPEMMKFLTKDDIVNLFDFYFRNLHRRFPILNPAFHKPERVAQRSPFLLTVICAVAAHFSESHANHAQRLAEISKKLCFEVPSRGSKTTEIVQALLILTVWTIASPPTRHEEDRSYLVLGLAKSMMGDLGLHRLEPSRSLSGERSAEMDNRIRTYLHCYLRDHELSVQLGRIPTVREIPCIRNPDFFFPSPLTMEDLFTCMMIEFFRILSRTLQYFQLGMEYSDTENARCNYDLATNQFEDQLNGWNERYTQLFKNALSENKVVPIPNTTLAEYAAYSKFAYHFGMLSVDSFGLADALERSTMDVTNYFNKCYSAATNVLNVAKHTLSEFSSGFKFANDGYYVCISYAAVSLLRFCRPKFSKLHNFNDEIAELITSVADALVTNSITPSHISNSYGLFLRTLVSTRNSGPFASAAVTPRAASPMQQDTHENPALHTAHLFGDDQLNGGANKFFDALNEDNIGFGLDQLVPSQWSALDRRLDTVYSLAASDTWDSVLPPGFNFNLMNTDVSNLPTF